MPRHSSGFDSENERTPPQGWSTDRILPEGFRPMLASPASAPADPAGYGIELRWGGLRALVGFEAADVSCVGTTGQDLLPWFPEVADLVLRSCRDGCWWMWRLVCMREGRPDAAALRQRTSEPVSEALRAELPVRCVVSDVLRIGNSWLTDIAWDERREVLTQVFRAGTTGVLAPVFSNYRAALDQGRRLGLTECFAKRRRGRYFPGERAREWLLIREETEAPAQGRRETPAASRRTAATPIARED